MEGGGRARRTGHEHTVARRAERGRQKERKRKEREEAGQPSAVVPGRKLTKVVTVTQHYESEAGVPKIMHTRTHSCTRHAHDARDTHAPTCTYTYAVHNKTHAQKQ